MQDFVGFWFRRDLRVQDNHALFQALGSGSKVIPIFIFDEHILSDLRDEFDPRVSFIHQCLSSINSRFLKFNSGLQVYKGKPQELIPEIAEKHNFSALYLNEDYEPYALDRDAKVKEALNVKGIKFLSFQDHVLVHPNQVLKSDGKPYSVYTPYFKKWIQSISRKEEFPSEKSLDALKKLSPRLLALEDLGFKPSKIQVEDFNISKSNLLNYQEERDRPDKDSTSKLSVHLRFGTVGIREVFNAVNGHSETFLKELAWREFFIQVLHHNPRVVFESFKPKYDRIKWRNDEAEFEKWKQGKTGFSLVDAGMRQLNTTGWMHNRVRMLVASFLTKHLLIDWRWGEAYFAEKLLDYELASNNGNWQWAAGSGCDAAPYFRIFNPITQAEKFDPEGEYRKKYIEDWKQDGYPSQMVNHKEARLRCLETYEEGIKSV